MSSLQLDLLLFGGLLLFILVGGLILRQHNSPARRLEQRLQTHVRSARSTRAQAAPASGLTTVLGTQLQKLGRVLPLFDAKQRQEMTGKLAAAGYRKPAAMALMVGLSGVSGLGVGLLIILIGWPMMGSGNPALRIVILLAGAYIGMMIPRIVLDRLVARRQAAIQNSFPDALDLLVVCTNSGLGLNASLQRVAIELQDIAPELADELTLTSGQLQLSGDVAEILHEMAERIGLASIRSLVATLIQSRRYGTPIGHALRVLSQSERTARLMRTEEAAAKLATKITLPMMLFILPTVLIIGGGPAILQLMEIFANQTP